MPLGNLLLSYLYRRVDRFLRGAENGRAVQRRVLLEKVRRHTDSDFGRDHGFAEIRTVDDFRRRMPITRYDDYTAYIERLKRGEIGAMFGPGTKLRMFALTTGTTSRYKHIPVTQEFFDEYIYGLRIWGIRVVRDHYPNVSGRALKLGSDWRLSYTEAGIPCGHITGLVTDAAAWFARRRYVLPAAWLRIRDPAAKQYAALRIALSEPDLGLIATANPSTLVEMARLAAARGDDLIRDLHDGALSREFDLPQALRDELRPWLRKGGPKRARQLQAALDDNGGLDLRQAWPRLWVLGVWLGGSVGIYLPQLREYFGDVSVRDHGLAASEGHMTIPLDNNTSSGLLEYASHYFEFIPVDERDKLNPTVLEAHELSEGRDYYILLTTSSGLYRYDIQDVVRCTGFLGQMPMLQFLNKGAYFSSVTGEKLTESQVVAAVRTVFERERLPLETFTVAPVMRERPQYVMLLEPGRHDGREAELAEAIDVELSRSNCEYEERLTTRRLEPLMIEPIAPGTWSAFRAEKSAADGAHGIYKHQCLNNDLSFAAKLRQKFGDYANAGG